MSYRIDVKGIIGRVTMCMCALLATSCTKEDPTSLPKNGEVVYDVIYSTNILDETSYGNFLPRTVIGIYDTTSVKLSLSAPLGMMTMNLVMSPAEDFVTVTFDDAKLIMPMQGLLEVDSALMMAEGLKVNMQMDTEISGIPSKHVTVMPMTADSIDTRLDICFQPFDGMNAEYNASDFIRTRAEHKPVNFGVVTAINVTVGETSIMMMAKSVKPKKGITAKDFERPQGYLEATKRELMTMYDMMQN